MKTKTTPAQRLAAKKETAYTFNRDGKKVKVSIPEKEELSDELNPAFIFQTIHTELLTAILRGDIDAPKRAASELANRGLDLTTGVWVGFAAANKQFRTLYPNG